MENASKALIIAGGVLIAVLLLTLFSYLFREMSSGTSSVYELLEKHEIDEFNQQFYNFEGRGIGSVKPLNAQDVATLINLAQNSEKKSKFRTKVSVMLNNENIAEESTAENWLKNNLGSQNKYKCKSVTVNSATRLVNQVLLEDI